MSGPPPKDPSIRRRANPTPGFKLLPHEGRKGPIPEWPLYENPDKALAHAEMDKWRELWRLPQAAEWERMRDYGTVALYCRVFAAASMPGADPKLLAQWRFLDAKIGASSKAMMELRWQTDEPVPEPPDEPPPKVRRLIAAE